MSECESPLLTPGLPVAPAEMAGGGPWFSSQALQCAAGRRDPGTGSVSPTAWQTRQGRREVHLSYITAAVWGHGFGWG